MTITVIHGDMRAELPKLEADSLDACLCDPPYGINFMSKKWDDNVAFRVETWGEVMRVLKPGAYLLAFGGTRTFHRMACAIEDAGFEIRDTLAWIFGSGFPKHKNALKPAYEPIIMARKDLGERTVAGNVLKFGTGALNLNACKIPEDSKCDPGSGRWPANVCHDGSEEVEVAFAAFGERKTGGTNGVPIRTGDGLAFAMGPAPRTGYADNGTAARFFYTAKADKEDRLQSKHPTVKPVDLMRWLARMVTPTGGTMLDCFAGSGTTGMAAMAEGFNAVLIEREAEYVADIRRRLAHVQGSDTPLFAEVIGKGMENGETQRDFVDIFSDFPIIISRSPKC